MRYQQPIYIQNQNSCVRNNDILNVNMSSEISIFEAPVFTMSGASKIDCECGCPSGYTLLENGVCQFIDSISATTYGTLYTGYTGNVSIAYTSNGTYFFKNNLTGLLPYSLSGSSGNGVVIDSTSSTTITQDAIVSTGTLWFSLANVVDGRLNNCGVWATAGAPANNPPYNQWIGFSKCINLNTSGVYSIGLAGDNRVRFKINSELFYDGNKDILGSFSIWRVFEVTLSAGTNVIELEGYNIGGAASFGAEIYNVGIDVLSGLTSEAQLASYTVFTTKDYRYDVTGIPLEFNLGESSGYSCPSGYFLNTCETPFSCSTLVMTACTIPISEYYIIEETDEVIPITFDFTSNTETFTADSATFKFSIYKYNANPGIFVLPPVYKSDNISFSAISGTSSYTENVNSSNLKLDGEYLVKGFYNFDVQTEYLNKLGKKIDTSSFIGGDNYGLYNKNLDFYFSAIKKADKPTLLSNGSNTPPANQLFQQVIIPNAGDTNIILTNEYAGFFILTLNGLVLAPNYDFTYTGSVVTLVSPTVYGDIITISYTTNGLSTLMGDNISISSPITSGATDNQGTNVVYYNTSTSKFEIYTTVTPADGGSILVMINGITLAKGIDFYQSKTNKKRIILEGNLLVGDIITIVYFPTTNLVNGINVSNPTVTWKINQSPQLNNGYFSLEVSSGDTFPNFYYSGSTDYSVGNTLYSDSFIASGTVGTKLYYRVKNTKNYETICGNIINSVTYSDILPIIIQTNSINSY